MSYIKPDILYDYSQRYLSTRQQRYLAFAHPLIKEKFSQPTVPAILPIESVGICQFIIPANSRSARRIIGAAQRRITTMFKISRDYLSK